MRIIGGTLRSRQIRSPEGKQARPTSDRVRESLFSVIGREVEDQCVLDLFAGPGTLGIEAVSRGASFVTFVEASERVSAVLRTNLRDLSIEEKASVKTGDVFDAVRGMSLRKAKFGLVFLDPPYSKGYAVRALRLVMESGIVPEDGMIVVEHSIREVMADPAVGFSLRKVLRFGETQVSIYRRQPCER